MGKEKENKVNETEGDKLKLQYYSKNHKTLSNSVAKKWATLTILINLQRVQIKILGHQLHLNKRWINTLPSPASPWLNLQKSKKTVNILQVVLLQRITNISITTFYTKRNVKNTLTAENPIY